MITEISSGKGSVCASILATLPTFFGIAESNAAYIRDVEEMPMFAAVENDEPQGFIAMKGHMPGGAAEIYVMGVRPNLHRKGIGRALVAHGEEWARSAGFRFLTVKTLADLHPDPGYVRTRAFYRGVGFTPLEVFPLLWGAENPALVMVKAL